MQSPALIYLTPFTPCSSLLAQRAPCAGGRAEFLNHSLLGRSEGSTPCYLFFERSLIVPCFWFWQCHYYLLLRSSFFALPMLCSEETNRVVFFCEVFYLAKKVFCGCILLLILSVTLRNEHIKYISHPAITSCFSCLILCFLFLLFLFHCKLL